MRSTHTPTLPLDHKTILVADDDPVFCQLAKFSFEKAGANVICAQSGLRAMGILANRRVDAATIALNMPEIDGLRLLEHLRQMPETKTIPIAIITSSHNARLDRDALRLNNLSYQLKPVIWSELIEWLSHSFRQSSFEHVSWNLV